jgi:hypothetical protein
MYTHRVNLGERPIEILHVGADRSTELSFAITSR